VRTEDRGKYVFSSGVNALQCHIMGIVFQRGVGSADPIISNVNPSLAGKRETKLNKCKWRE
jgi:hypothetical protein